MRRPTTWLGHLFLAGLVLGSTWAHAQGTVRVSNTTPDANAPVYDRAVGGTPLEGDAFLAQLYAGPPGAPEDQLQPAGAPLPFRTGAGAGRLTPTDSTRIIPGIPGGAPAELQLRAWTAASGATYEDAVAQARNTHDPAHRFGRSPPFTVALGGPVPDRPLDPPLPPATLAGLQSFAIAPWPGWPAPDSPTNLVVNGTFDWGSAGGWTQPTGFIGVVAAPGSAQGGLGDWISFDGVLAQDLNTVPGQSYLLSFATAGYSPTPVPHSARLKASWDHLVVTDLLFPSQTPGWHQPAFVVTASSTVTRLAFEGAGLPPLDDVSVVPLPPLQPTVAITQPQPETVLPERGSLRIVVAPASPVGSTVQRVDFFHDGYHLIGTVTHPPYEMVWTNLPVGAHLVAARVTDSAELCTMSLGVPVRVRSVPTVHLLGPAEEQVFETGEPVPIRAALTGNDGTAVQLDLLANGQLLHSFAVASPSSSHDYTWNGVPVGNYALEAVALDANHNPLHAAAVTVHVLNHPTRDLIQNLGADASVRISTNIVTAQTFSPNVAGTLHHIDVGLAPGAYFEIYPVRMDVIPVAANGMPATNGPSLGTAWFPASAVAAGVHPASFYFTSNQVRLHPGERYAFVLSTASPFYGLSLPANMYNSYPQGALWLQAADFTWGPMTLFEEPNTNLDLAFATHVIPDVPPWIRNLAAAPLAISQSPNRQTGLFEQLVVVSNTTELTFEAVRLWVQLDEASAARGARLWNATGSSNGVPFALIAHPLAPGSHSRFQLEFYVPDRATVPAASFVAEAIPRPTLAFPQGLTLAIDRVLRLATGGVLIEFPSLLGRRYTVQYSADALNWKTAQPPIDGNGSRVQWLDLGPPKTDSPPLADTTRFYRLILWP